MFVGKRKQRGIVFKYSNDRYENDDFYVTSGTVFDSIDDVKSGLVAARRCAVLEMVREHRSKIIKNKIKNL